MSMVMTVKLIRDKGAALNRISSAIYCENVQATRSECASERMEHVMAARDLMLKAARELEIACACSGKGVNHER